MRKILREYTQRLTKLLLIFPHNPQLWLQRGLVLLHLSFPDLALSDLWKSQRLSKNKPVFDSPAPTPYVSLMINPRYASPTLRQVALASLCEALLLCGCLLESLSLLSEKHPAYFDFFKPFGPFVRQLASKHETGTGTSARYGCLQSVTYPWMEPPSHARNIQRLSKFVEALSNGACSFGLSPTLKYEDGQQADVIVAQHRIEKGAKIMTGQYARVAGEPDNQTCSWCSQSVIIESGNNKDCIFCTEISLPQTNQTPRQAHASDTGCAHERSLASLTRRETKLAKLRRLLLSRILVAMAESPEQVPPLDNVLLSEDDPDSGVGRANQFSFNRDVRNVLEFLEQQGVDIYANHNLDIWVINILRQKIMTSTYEQSDCVVISRTEYLFENSENPNVGGRYNQETGRVELSAIRDIAEGEVLYLDDEYFIQFPTTIVISNSR